MASSLSTEEKLDRIRRAWPLWVGVIATAVINKYGDEGRQLVKEALYDQGRTTAKAFLETSPVEPTVPGPLDFVLPLMTVSGFEPEISELSSSRAVIRHYTCKFQECWKLVSAPRDMCEIWESYFRGMREVINSKFTVTRLLRLYHGDPCCEQIWAIEE